MLFPAPNLPSCNHCGCPPLVDRVGDEGHYQFFVLCQSPASCGAPNGRGTRVLSNGKPSQGEAEADWRKTVNDAMGFR